MLWAEITLEVPPASVEPASASLSEIGCAGVVVVDPFAVSSDPFAEWAVRDNPRPDASTVVRVSGYLPIDDRLEPALGELKLRLDLLHSFGIGMGDGISLRHVDDASWADAWKSFYKPVRVGQRIVIKPSWEEWEESPADLVLELDPGMAFGTGCHPSTRLCLQLLEHRIQGGERVLDWGTGSGVLALAAARLGAGPILAIDLDPTAVSVAQNNIVRNQLGDRIEARAGSIETLPATLSYELILANIVADPIIAGVGAIRARLVEGGSAIVSGFVEAREEEVAAALSAAGLTPARSAAEEDWRALLVNAS
jgi:ribosomal protein L11 methyltransferase